MPAGNQGTEAAGQEAARGTADRAVESRGVAVPAFSLIELRPAEQSFMFTLASGTKQTVPWGEPFKHAIPTQDQLPAGDYRCLVRPEGAIEVGNIRIVFVGFESFPAEVRRAFDEPKREVPCKVVWGTATDAARDEVQEMQQRAPGLPAGHQFPVKANPETLRTNARLRAFVWELLNHFANAPDKPGPQVSYEDIQAHVAKDPNAREIVARTTQAWGEFQSARSQDYGVFERLAEALVEQWTFGNATVRDNQLALRDKPEGWGLYHRGNGIKYYNEFGVPIESFMGSMWEKHYRWADKSKSTSPLPIEVSPNDPIFSIIEAYRAGGVPHPEMIKAAAKGYFENGLLLLEEIRNNPAKWENIEKLLHEHVPVLAVFLGIQGLITFLGIQPHWAPKLVGEVLAAMLKGTAYFFDIRFVGDATKVVLEIGAALYRVKRGKDGKPDRLSQRHLAEAADLVRGLLEELGELLLVATATKTAEVTAKVLPPAGPSGPKPQLATATAGVAGGTPVETSAGTMAAAAGGPRIPPGIVLMGKGGGKETAGEKAERERQTKREREDIKAREAAERARREGEKEWREVEKELTDSLTHEAKAFDEVRYSGKQANTVFSDLLNNLEARARATKSAGELGRVEEARTRAKELFKETQTIDKLLDKVGLKRAYEKYQKYVERGKARALDRLRQAQMNKEWGPDEYQIAYDDLKYLESLSDQLKRFREGLISRRKFDGVQVFVERRHVGLTDATMRVKEIFHQMKSIVYREIWQQVFPDFRVTVFEFKSQTAVYEIKPTPDFAHNLEHAIDLKLAQESTK